MKSQVSSPDVTQPVVEDPIGWNPPPPLLVDLPVEGATTQDSPPPSSPLSEPGSGSAGDASSPSSARARTSSSPGFSDPEAFEQPIGTLLGLAAIGGDVLARGEGRWLPMPEEVEAVAAPLARIAARHSPVNMAKSSDAADVLEAGVGVAGYAVSRIMQAKLEGAGQPAPEDALADAGEG